MKKKMPWWGIVIIILLLVLISLVGYSVILMNQTNNEVKTKPNQKEEVKEKEEKDTGEELSVTDSRVVNVMNPFKSMNSSYTDDYFGYFYEHEKNEVNALPDDLKIFIAIKTMEKDLEKQAEEKEIASPGTMPTVVVSGSEVSNVMKQLYGDTPYNNVSLKGKGCAYNGFAYDATTDTYSQIVPGCGGVDQAYYETKVKSATLYKDRLEVNVLTGYVEYANNEKIVYNSKAEKNEITRISRDGNVDLLQNEENAHEYTFSFKRNADQTYSFISANRIR